MAGAAPKTDKWTARENTQKTDIVLIVSGLVQVSNTNEDPVLTEGEGAGKTLVVDLAVKTGSDPGLAVQVWKRATLSKDVSADHYDKVEIRWDGKAIATCDVKSDDEHHTHLETLTEAANKAHAKDKPPAPPKPKPRPAPKKRPPVAPKKRPPAAKKRPAAAKKRPPAAKKRPAAPKKRKSAAAKKRASGPKKRSAAKKRTSASAKKRRPVAAKKRRSAAKKRRPASRRR
jgi:hypothetical protein